MTKCHCIEKVPHGTEDGGGEFSFTGQVQVRSQKPKHHLAVWQHKRSPLEYSSVKTLPSP